MESQVTIAEPVADSPITSDMVIVEKPVESEQVPAEETAPATTEEKPATTDPAPDTTQVDAKADEKPEEPESKEPDLTKTQIECDRYLKRFRVWDIVQYKWVAYDPSGIEKPKESEKDPKNYFYVDIRYQSAQREYPPPTYRSLINLSHKR